MPIKVFTGVEDSPETDPRATAAGEQKSTKVETWLIRPAHHIEETKFREKWREMNWGLPHVEFTFLPGDILQAHVQSAPGISWDPRELIRALDAALRQGWATDRPEPLPSR